MATLLYLFSMGVCFFTLSMFRIVNIKIFLAVLFVLSSIYCIVKKFPNFKSFSFKSKPQQLSIASLLTCFLFVDFSSYITHVSPSILRRLPLPPIVTAMIISIVCCVLSFLFLFILAESIQKLLCMFISILKTYKYSFLMLSGIYLIGMTAIIRADFSYYDDLGRVLSGLDMTGSFSRHTSTFLSNFLNGNTRLSDISPLPQILAVLIIAFAGILLLHILDDVCGTPKKFSIWRTFSLVPLCLSPYFLQCLSYKFDSPYMAASVLFSIAPLIFYKAGGKKFMAATCIGTLLMCTTYQAASGIFPVLVFLITSWLWNQKVSWKKIFSFAAHAFCGYAAGLMIFRFFIMIKQASYVDSSISLQSIGSNLSIYANAFLTNYTPLWITLIVIICITFITVMVTSSKHPLALSIPVALLTVIGMAILSFGVYIVFSDILLAVRSMYGFCVFLALLGVMITTNVRLPFAKASVILFSWLMLVFTFTYGNALAQQKAYSQFRVEEVISGFNQIDAIKSDNQVYVQIVGSIGYCDAVENLLPEYGALGSLVPTMFDDKDGFFGHYPLCEYYKLNLAYDPNMDMTQMDLPTISDTAYHTIKSSDNYLLVYLK